MFVYSHVVLDNYLTGEANVTAMHVEKLISSGVSKDDIAVISPYNLQVSTEFCGYQSECVICSIFVSLFSQC